MEEIIVHAYDWIIRDKYGDDDHVNIHCWALDRESRPCLLRFTDFFAFCHVELPMIVRNNFYDWNKYKAGEFVNMLNNRLGDDACVKYSFDSKKKTYFYRQERKFPMLLLCFNTLAAMQHCARMLSY